MKTLVKLSLTSKLEGIYSWSLAALETCPGSLGEDGELVDACKSCYATDGFYRMQAAVSLRDYNREDWQRAEWVPDMVQALQNERFFRWFDSGDMYSLKLAEKIYQVMKGTSWVAHWIPTRMEKFSKFAAIISKMRALPNVSVRFSSDSIRGKFGPAHGSVIVPTSNHRPAGVKMCLAYTRGGRCGDCRLCYDPRVKTIAYPMHGRLGAKTLRETA